MSQQPLMLKEEENMHAYTMASVMLINHSGLLHNLVHVLTYQQSLLL